MWLLILMLTVTFIIDIIINVDLRGIVEEHKHRGSWWCKRLQDENIDTYRKIEELRSDIGKLYSLIESYSQLTCISAEEFDEKLEEVRKILEELEKRGNNNGKEEKNA